MIWKTYNTYIDLETGEVLEEHIAKTEYNIIKKIKKTQYNATTQRGTISYTNECKRSEQLKLFKENN